MKKIRRFIHFLSADPLRLIAAAGIPAAMIAVAAGFSVILPVVFLVGSSVCERISFWRNLRLCAAPEHSLRGALGFSIVTVLLRLSMLVVAGGKPLPLAMAMGIAPLLVVVVPLPLVGLYLQQRRMCEIVFPASARVLDARFRALLRPRAATSCLAEWYCAGAVIALATGAFPWMVCLTGLGIGAFTILSTLRFLTLPAASRLRSRFADEVAERIKADAPEVVFYHSGPAESLYQYRMWASVLDRLSLKTLAVFRESGYLSGIASSGHGTVFIRRFDHLYQLVPDSVKVILYAANGTSNINMLRWHLPAEHVFINHGESDKAVNMNYFLSVYTRLFVSGRQAIDRFGHSWFNIPSERFIIVGRPQLDDLAAAPSTGQGTLLYAPTWEGWNPAENYSSIETMGVPLIEHLLKCRPEIRIVFKPHPFCGKNRPAVGAAVRRIIALLAGDGRHAVIPGGDDIMPHLAAASLLVTDVSSVANDFLVTGRPLIMTDPLSLGAQTFRARFPTGEAAWLLDPDLGNIDGILSDALGGDSLCDARRRVFEYSMGGFRGNSTKKFDTALQHLAAEVMERRTTADHSC